MRGKVHDIPPTHDENRITPAYAGKSLWELRKNPVMEDHPRLCGEKLIMTVFSAVYGGSPPPMRGKGNGKEIAHLLHGITPAYAGKRSRNANR